MWKTIFFKNQKQKPADRGFITLEIIIALLIAFGFLMVSLQTLVLGMVFKIEAQEKQKADKLIQEDIENIQNIADLNTLNPRLAAILTDNDDLTTGLNSITGDPIDDVCNAATYDKGYAQALWYAFTNLDDNGDSIYSGSVIDTDPADGSVDLTYDSINTGDSIVINSNYQNNPTARLISIVDSSGVTQEAGDTLTLTRTHVTATTGVAPFRTLGLYYQVTKPGASGNPEIIANRYVEVSPDAALECP